ncbi:hypothetical protein RE428_36120 [Marinobacter nanhaiticus D15-8W]|uniref:diguanylate cyclase n=1 Tax=Marinobacter nanhaiticus D15-8W TaxID=626887 RepID=N6W954_9GAMM|nr:diguanylate cyclase [Marinobacter nanhaiticus]ENO16779.1 diguanylate cyclase [Marinobacter nanhaiticus D15-8W]BES72594.1 hypothetical protein RE428_36120 [Marinobacter nanhaiticus D15-8W]
MPREESVVSATVNDVLPYVFEHMDVAVVVADAEYRIAMVNNAACEMFGYAREELLGQKARILCADARGSSLYRRASDSARTNPPGNVTVTRYRRKSGERFDGETRGGALDGGSGQVVALIRDVSERIALERVLNRLYALMLCRNLSFEERVDAILRMGCDYFGLPVGIFSRIVGAVYEVRQVVHPEEAIARGTKLDFSDTYCSHVYKEGDVGAFHHVGQSELKTHPCYRNLKLEAYLGATIFVDGRRYGTLNFSSSQPANPFSAQDRELIRLFADWIGYELAHFNDLESVARTDPLTGLFNRRYAESRLEAELQRIRQFNLPLAVALVAVDNVKAMNTDFGHKAGDNALKLFAHKARLLGRLTDVIGRWGGGTFLIILPVTDEEGALKMLGRLAKGVGSTGSGVEEGPVELTLSIGLGLAQPVDDKYSLVQRVEEALYRAKASGGDCIRMGY